jgi:serine/threonine protein kinase
MPFEGLGCIAPHQKNRLGFERPKSREPSGISSSGPATDAENPVSIVGWMVQSLVDTLVDDQDGEADRPVRLKLEPGEQVGRYRLLHLLGAGGMGVVFAAQDTVLDRKVALKVVPEGHDRKSRRRLLREARAMARLDHPNVVRILGVGESGRNVFIAMELIDGMTLSRWMTAEARSWREILRVLLEAGRGLEAAHAAGIMHLDFKPDNVMIATDGRVYVLDFGLARAVKSVTAQLRALAEPPVSWTLEESATPGRAGAGTPRYMAPEQLARMECDERTDQFAFCVTAMEALFRGHPFPARSLGELAHKVTSGIIRRPCMASGIPIAIRDALIRGVKANPDHRHRNMSALLRVLERHVDGKPRRTLALGIVGLLGAAMMLAFPLGTFDSPTATPPAVSETAPERIDAPIPQGWTDSQEQLEAALLRGDLRTAERRARESMSIARGAEDHHRLAVARTQLASILRDMKRPDLARDLYEMAYFEARDTEDSDVAAEAAIELVSLLAEAPVADAEVRVWVRHARAQLDRSSETGGGSDPQVAALRARLEASHDIARSEAYRYPGLQ